jgi:hypothetical protein
MKNSEQFPKQRSQLGVKVTERDHMIRSSEFTRGQRGPLYSQLFEHVEYSKEMGRAHWRKNRPQVAPKGVFYVMGHVKVTWGLIT